MPVHSCAGVDLPQGREVRSLVEAVLELMDNPHPLAILGDRGAYMDSGSISRYHNPDNYTRAFGRLIHLKRTQEQQRAPERPVSRPRVEARVRVRQARWGGRVRVPA